MRRGQPVPCADAVAAAEPGRHARLTSRAWSNHPILSPTHPLINTYALQSRGTEPVKRNTAAWAAPLGAATFERRRRACCGGTSAQRRQRCNLPLNRFASAVLHRIALEVRCAERLASERVPRLAGERRHAGRRLCNIQTPVAVQISPGEPLQVPARRRPSRAASALFVWPPRRACCSLMPPAKSSEPTAVWPTLRFAPPPLPPPPLLPPPAQPLAPRLLSPRLWHLAPRGCTCQLWIGQRQAAKVAKPTSHLPPPPPARLPAGRSPPSPWRAARCCAGATTQAAMRSCAAASTTAWPCGRC